MDASCDLRRTRRREEAELILERAKHLPAQERALLESVFGMGQTAAHVAQVAGREARSVRREVRRLLARVLKREYPYVLVRKESWAGTRRLVATACFIEGLSMRTAAQRLGLTLHTVRRHCEAIRSKAEEAAVAERAALAALRGENE